MHLYISNELVFDLRNNQYWRAAEVQERDYTSKSFHFFLESLFILLMQKISYVEGAQMLFLHVVTGMWVLSLFISAFTVLEISMEV